MSVVKKKTEYINVSFVGYIFESNILHTVEILILLHLDVSYTAVCVSHIGYLAESVVLVIHLSP